MAQPSINERLFSQGMALNELALRMKLKGIRIDMERRKVHARRLALAIESARARFASLVPDSKLLEFTDPDLTALEDYLAAYDSGEMDWAEELLAARMTKLGDLKNLFFRTFGLSPTRFSPTTGGPSLDESALKDILENPVASDAAKQAVRALLAYRSAFKTKSTYVDRLALGHPKAYLFGGSDILHPTWNVLQAKTGRWSCSSPNLQNIQKDEKDGAGNVIRQGMRDMFIARDGMWFCEGDYKQLEVRIIAAITGDVPLITAFRNNLDIYKFAAADLFDKAMDKIVDGERQMAKIFILASNYGGGVPIIYGQLVLWFPSVTLKAVEIMQERWFNAHPAIPSYQRRMFKFAQENSFVACPLSGRRVPFYLDRIKPTEAANFPIQGSGGDIINPASIRADKELRWDRDEALLMQIHDALYSEGPDPHRLAEVMDRTMAVELDFGNGLKMPFPIDVKVGRCWGKMEKYERERRYEA